MPPPSSRRSAGSEGRTHRLTYAGLVADAGAIGLVVIDRQHGRFEIYRDAKSVVVCLGKSAWAYRRCDATRIPTPRLRLRAAYDYLGIALAEGRPASSGDA